MSWGPLRPARIVAIPLLVGVYYLPLDAAGHWRTALLRVLEIMAVG